MAGPVPEIMDTSGTPYIHRLHILANVGKPFIIFHFNFSDLMF
jgi:hypothetical protein